MPEMESVETVAAASRGAKLTKLTIQRNTCGPDDVTIDIKYAWQIFLYIKSMGREFCKFTTGFEESKKADSGRADNPGI